MSLEVLEVHGSRLHLLPVVRGLTSEAAAVRQAFQSSEPDAVALSISPEEMEGLRAQPEVDMPPANFEEELYVRELSRFGEVRKPPPCFVEAFRLSQASRRPLVALDMGDAQYTEAYTQNIGTVELILHSRGARRLRASSFPARTPEELVLLLDDVFNGSRGFRALERDREEYMALQLRNLAATYARPLAVVEVERARGIRRALA